MKSPFRFWLYASCISLLGFLSGGCPLINECQAFDGYYTSGAIDYYADIEQDTTDTYSFVIVRGAGNLIHIIDSYSSCSDSEKHYSSDLYFAMDTSLAFGDTIRFEDSALVAINCVYGIDLLGVTDLGYESMQPVTEGYVSYWKAWDASISEYIWMAYLGVMVDDIITPPGKIHLQFSGELYF